MYQSIQEEWAWVDAKIRRNYSLCFQGSMGLLMSLKTSFPWEYIKLKKKKEEICLDSLEIKLLG